MTWRQAGPSGPGPSSPRQPPRPRLPTPLGTSSITATSVRLGLSPALETWYYRVGSGSIQTASSAFITLTSLTANTAYTVIAYRDSAGTMELDRTAFSTNALPTYRLAASGIYETGFDLAISPAPPGGRWWYSLNGGTRVGVQGATAFPSRLSANVLYTVVAYDQASGGNELARTTVRTLALPTYVMTVRDVGNTEATLVLNPSRPTWYYSVNGGTRQRATGSTHTVEGLSEGTAYNIVAYTDRSGGTRMTNVRFTTTQRITYSLRASSITNTSAEVTISPSVTWYWRLGASGAITRSTAATITVSGLSATTSYTVTAFRDSAGREQLATVTFTTTAVTTPTASYGVYLGLASFLAVNQVAWLPRTLMQAGAMENGATAYLTGFGLQALGGTTPTSYRLYAIFGATAQDASARRDLIPALESGVWTIRDGLGRTYEFDLSDWSADSTEPYRFTLTNSAEFSVPAAC